MRIEICGSSINGSLALSGYQSQLSSFVSDVESIVSCFKDVKKKTYDLSGGIGDLQVCLDNIQSRIEIETQRKESATAIQSKTNDFIDLAKRVDSEVASLVNRNKEEFYKINPWLKPAPDPSEKPWYERAWDWICQAGETIGETLEKAWDGLVKFYNEHKDEIEVLLSALGTILLLVGAIVLVIIAPVGTLLGAILIGAAMGAASGAIIGGVSEGLKSRAEGGSFLEGFLKGSYKGAVSGFLGGALFGALGYAGAAIGVGVSSLTAIGKTIKVICVVSKAISYGMLSFDVLALADLAFDPEDNPIYDLNNQAHSSSVYNAVQIGSGILATFTGGMTKTMNNNPPSTTSQAPDNSQLKSGTDGYGDNINFEKDTMADDRYFSKGNNYDEYKDYWESGGKNYDYVKSNDKTIQMIDARDIEGVDVHSNDLKNPSQFWNGSGRHGQSSYKDFILDGRIQNTPVEVEKIISNNKTFYLFVEDGRHRILTAQEMGVKIPAIIVGTYISK